VMTHWRLSSLKPRSPWADGSAMFTIVASRITMSWAMPRMPRMSQRRSWWGSTAAAVGEEDMRILVTGAGSAAGSGDERSGGG
jgi:hypothetical protein